jgi:hypothetical protein
MLFGFALEIHHACIAVTTTSNLSKRRPSLLFASLHSRSRPTLSSLDAKECDADHILA